MKRVRASNVSSIGPASQAFDLSGVRLPPLRDPQGKARNIPQRPHIFGLPAAPTYYPTAEEFADPLEYIQKIRPQAEQAGICKIVPPEGWNPPFSLDTKNFRFKTRIQQLNSLEGKTRSNLNYQDQLYRFHAQQGQPLIKVPQLDHRPIDLYDLRNEVASRGGYQKVNGSKMWAEIGRVLKYDRKTCTSMSNALKSTYQKIILPFEQYLAKHGGSAKSAAGGAQQFKSTVSLTDDATGSGVDSPGGAKRRRSSRFGENSSVFDTASEADTTGDVANDSSHSSVIPEQCEVCRSGENDEKMLICDGCDRGFHMYCLSPPLSTIPTNDWYCNACVLGAGTDFGFEDGAEHTLESFKRKGDEFKRRFFAQYYESVTDGRMEGRVPEDVVEREFWRLVASPFEDVEVEYGADLHSAQHGSGFPTVERNPLERYSRHPWNLNVLPFQPESLFNHINQDISGMMTPWIYVGMCFSTFCWHNEDHYTYSVNYMHWGDTKTWYGVPGAHATQFEDAMRAAVPQLFADQPDLLMQLVTMLSPEVLVARGVPVVTCDQRAGEFVLTFPQSYHAGFNQGVNFNEAVNFATPDWLPFDVPSVRRYQHYARNPVFSHDELIVNMAAQYSSEPWFRVAATEMVTRELTDRAIVRQVGIRREAPWNNVDEGDPDLPEEIRQQCVQCKAFAYLSAVVCSCTPNYIRCLNHADKTCKCPPASKTLKVRYSDSELRRMLGDSSALFQPEVSRAHVWESEFRRLMSAPASPSASIVTGTTAVEKGSASDSEVQEVKKDQAVDSPKSMPKPTLDLASVRSRPELTQMVVLLEEAHRLVVQDTNTFSVDISSLASPTNMASAGAQAGAPVLVTIPVSATTPTSPSSQGHGGGRGGRGRRGGRGGRGGRGARRGTGLPGRPTRATAASSAEAEDPATTVVTIKAAPPTAASADSIAMISREIEQLSLYYNADTDSEEPVDASSTDLQILTDVRQLSHFVRRAQDWCRAVHAVLMGLNQRRMVDRIVSMNQGRYRRHRHELDARFGALLNSGGPMYSDMTVPAEVNVKPPVSSAAHSPYIAQPVSAKRERQYRTDSEEDADESSSQTDNDDGDGEFRATWMSDGRRFSSGRATRRKRAKVVAAPAAPATPQTSALPGLVPRKRRGRPPKNRDALEAPLTASSSSSNSLAPPALSTRSNTDVPRTRSAAVLSPTSAGSDKFFGSEPLSPNRESSGVNQGSMFRHSLTYYYSKAQLAAAAQRVLGEDAGGPYAATSAVYTMDDIVKLLQLGDQLFIYSAEFEVLLEFEAAMLEACMDATRIIDSSASELTKMAIVLGHGPNSSAEYAARKKEFLESIDYAESSLSSHGIVFPQNKMLDALRSAPGWGERCTMAFKYNKLTPESMAELLADAKRIQLDDRVEQYVRLREISREFDEWSESANAVISQKHEKIDIRNVGKLLEKGRNMVFLPESYNELRKLQQTALDLQAQTDKLIDGADSTDLVKRPRYQRAVDLVNAYEEFGRLELSRIENLRSEIARVDAWNTEVHEMFSPTAAYFSVPSEAVLGHVQQHLRRTLGILADEHSDSPKAAGAVDLYCVCLQPEGGLMVECEHCREWYHASCVNIGEKDIEEYQFFCPMCTAATKNEKPKLMADYPHLSRVDRAVKSGRELSLVASDLELLVTILLDSNQLVSAVREIAAASAATMNKGGQESESSEKSKRIRDLRTALRALLGLGVNLRHGVLEDLWTQLVSATDGKPVATRAATPGDASVGSKVQVLKPLAPTNDGVSDNSNLSPELLPAIQEVPTRSNTEEATVSINATDKPDESQPKSKPDPEKFQQQASGLAYLILNPPFEEDERGQGLVCAGDSFALDSPNCTCNTIGADVSDDILDLTDPRCAAAPVVQCDYCNEYFHIQCACVPAHFARLIFFHQMRRLLDADFDLDFELPQGPEEYKCPNCCYDLNEMYEYGELFEA
ncbi:hypothetical protein GGI15_003585 [Coemansia interrupta]|uniref:[histone H3]-trimethyl-L-lysine(4) demethylase n=1 Tax=Coemansia interrupta TaxID=1126814 RepID=A0A9W8H7M1_9FUNG|nr:hypothetical protein GGI15_003585 [Coemansia interrupta]